MIRSGGGRGKLGPWMSFYLYGIRREAWKTGWILHDLGISSWYDRDDRTLVILKGPSLFAANLGSMMFLVSFCASSQTLSPIMNGVNLDWIQIFMVNQASSCMAEASSLDFTRSFSHFWQQGGPFYWWCQGVLAVHIPLWGRKGIFQWWNVVRCYGWIWPWEFALPSQKG